MLLPRGFLWAAFIGGEECPGLDPNLPNSMFVCEVTGKYNVAMPLFKIHGEEPLPNGNRRIIATTKDCVKDSETVSEAAECIQVKQAGYDNHRVRDTAAAVNGSHTLIATPQRSGLVTLPDQCCRPTPACWEFFHDHPKHGATDDCLTNTCCFLDFFSSCPQPPGLKGEIDFEKPPGCTGPRELS